MSSRRSPSTPGDGTPPLGAATRSGCSSSTGGGMRTLLKLMSRTTSRTSPRSAPCTARPWARTPTRTTPAQERDAGVPPHPDPPGAGGTAPGDPRTTHGLIVYRSRSWRSRRRSRVLLGGDNPAPRDGQEEEVRAGQAVRGLLCGWSSEGSSMAAVKRCGTSCCRSRLRVQQGALRGLRRRLLLDGVTSRQLPTEYMAALLTACATQGQVGALPQRVPRMGIHGAPAGRQPSSANFTAVDKDTVRAHVRAQRVPTSWTPSCAPGGEWASRPSPTSSTRCLPWCATAHHRVAHQGRGVRLARSYAARAQVVHEQAVDPSSGSSAGAEGQFDLFAASAGLRRRGYVLPDRHPGLPDWDKTELLSSSGTCRPVRLDHPLPVLSTSSRRPPRRPSRRSSPTRPARGSTVVIAGHHHVAPAKDVEAGHPWAAVTIEDLDGASR